MIYFLYSKDGKKPNQLSKSWSIEGVPWHCCSIKQFLEIDVISDFQIFVYLDEMSEKLIDDNAEFFKKIGFVIFTGDFSKASVELLRKISIHGVFIDERSVNRDLFGLYLEEGKIIRENYQKLKNAEKNMQEFLAFLAHEIRTPLTSIMGAADLYTSETDSEVKDKYVRSIIDSSNFLLKILNQNLDYAKVKEGKLELSESQFYLPKILDEVKDLVLPRIDQKKINLTVNVDSSVPHYLYGDAERLEQILINIVGNSIKFTPNKGEISIDVSYLGEFDNSYKLAFSIADTGSGIAANKLDKIFSKYEQENELVRKQYGGTGLGLNISQLFVEKMGGEIKVTSKLGQGSQFTFDVLLKKPEIKTKKIALFSSKEESLLVGLCNKLLDAGHELNILNDKRNIIKGIKEKIIDCVLINGFEKEDEINQVLKIKAENSDVQFLVLDSMPNNTANLIASDENLVILNRDSSEAILNRIQSFSPSKNIISSDNIIQKSDSRLKVLVVDDGPDIQMIIRAYFKKVGLDVDTADNGLEAYEKITSNGDYDVILMDLQMPVMNGLDATKKIRQWESKNKRTPLSIIALTAASFKEDIDNVYAVGCDFHLAKPIEKDKLIESVFEHAKYKKAS